jgi:uncharacterized protein YegP (UPF0339 family)
MKIEVLKAKNGQWYYRIKSRNGKILCTSETYTRKTSAKNTAWKLSRNMWFPKFPIEIKVIE